MSSPCTFYELVVVNAQDIRKACDRVKAWRDCIAYRTPTTCPIPTVFLAVCSTQSALSTDTRDLLTAGELVPLCARRERAAARSRLRHTASHTVSQPLTRFVRSFLQYALLIWRSLMILGTSVPPHYLYGYALIREEAAGGFCLERPPRCQQEPFPKRESNESLALLGVARAGDCRQLTARKRTSRPSLCTGGSPHCIS